MIYVIILNLRQNGWKLKSSYRITGASQRTKQLFNRISDAQKCNFLRKTYFLLVISLQLANRAMVTLGWAVLRSKGEAGGGGGEA